ncbi:hypothetical protein [Novosphingopyxis baekryungensis]|uniref:hypothetical protein n=1 Tax=Novosphingopyxis baekryungensis TaxID=279369 RepID=UPI0003B4DF9F|nr:hypothetical protein [Novosphingopyxis baekryungensis]
MLFYRLTDEEAKRNQIGLFIGVPIVFLIADGLKRTNGTTIGYGFVAFMTVLYVLLLWQISTSRRLNRSERDSNTHD